MLLFAENLTKISGTPSPPFVIHMLACAIPVLLFVVFAILRQRNCPYLTIITLAGLALGLSLARILLHEPYPGASFWSMLEQDWHALGREEVVVSSLAGFGASLAAVVLLGLLGCKVDDWNNPPLQPNRPDPSTQPFSVSSPTPGQSQGGLRGE